MSRSLIKTLRPWFILLVILSAVAYALWKYVPLSPSADTHQGPPGMGGPGGSGAGPSAGQGGPGRGGAPGGGGGRRGMFGDMLVSVGTVTESPLSVQYDAVGTVTSLNTVNVTARVDGQLSKILFVEGQDVKEGDVLAEIDPRPYQAALRQAEGVVAQYSAQLKNAEIDLARYQELRTEDSIAIQTLDTQAALVRQYQGNLENAMGQLEAARLNLDFTRVRAPISGRIGLRQVDLGNQVTANATTPITVLTQTRPISVVFSLPEQQLTEVRQQLKQNPARLQVDALDRQRQVRLARGKVLSLDNQIDTTTGTFKIRAQFDNADDSLYPNQFVNVRLHAAQVEKALLIPSGALQRDDEGTYVYLVNDEKKVAKQRVSIGVSQNEQVEIRSGLKVGQRIVIDGVDRLSDGNKVRIAGEEDAGGNGGQRKWHKNGGGQEQAVADPSGSPGAAGGSADAHSSVQRDKTMGSGTATPEDTKPSRGAWRSEADGSNHANGEGAGKWRSRDGAEGGPPDGERPRRRWDGQVPDQANGEQRKDAAR